MKFPEKYELVKVSESIYNDALKRELSDYEYDGYVDFVNSPTCSYDLDNNMVVPFELNSRELAENKYFVLKNGEILEAGRNRRFLQSSTVKFGKDFGLQDFFDKNKDSLGMVFYVPQESGGSVFHAGNHIRVSVITSQMYEKEKVAFSEGIEGN